MRHANVSDGRGAAPRTASCYEEKKWLKEKPEMTKKWKQGRGGGAKDKARGARVKLFCARVRNGQTAGKKKTRTVQQNKKILHYEEIGAGNCSQDKIRTNSTGGSIRFWKLLKQLRIVNLLKKGRGDKPGTRKLDYEDGTVNRGSHTWWILEKGKRGGVLRLEKNLGLRDAPNRVLRSMRDG